MQNSRVIKVLVSDIKKQNVHPGGGVVSALAFHSGGPSSRLGLGGEALILLYPLEVIRQSNSIAATLMGRSRMTYDIDGYVNKSIKKKKTRF